MKRRLFVALWGGASYSHPGYAEPYNSLAEAAAEFERRRHDRYYPCWGDRHVADFNSEARHHAGFAYYVGADDPDIGTYDEREDVLTSLDRYPDRELTVGPRDGLRWEPT